MVALASTAAYGVSFNESCADGSKTPFSGVGTLNAAKNGLTVVVASADELAASYSDASPYPHGILRVFCKPDFSAQRIRPKLQ